MDIEEKLKDFRKANALKWTQALFQENEDLYIRCSYDPLLKDMKWAEFQHIVEAEAPENFALVSAEIAAEKERLEVVQGQEETEQGELKKLTDVQTDIKNLLLRKFDLPKPRTVLKTVHRDSSGKVVAIKEVEE